MCFVARTLQTLMGRIKRGAVGMADAEAPQTQRGINISDGVRDERSHHAGGAAELPLVEPEVARQPVFPTKVHWSVSSEWDKSMIASRRGLAHSRKAFAKQELQWNKKRMLEHRKSSRL